MSVPDFKHVVEEMAAQHPEAWHHAHRGGPRTEEFVRLLTARLHAVDPNVGLNGKRGDPNNISDDALCYKGVSVYGDVDPTRGNAPVTVIDFIGGAPSDYSGPDGRPAWNAVTDPNTRPTKAAWVQPATSAPTPTPQPSTVWTPAHESIRQRLSGIDSVARALTIAQQLCHSFPSEQWGEKRTRHGDWSPDTIGRLIDGRLWAIKLTPLTIYGFLPADAHVFRAVAPFNHLGEVISPPPPPPPVDPTPPPAGMDLQPVLDAIAALAAKVDAQRQELIDTVKGQTYDIDVKAGPLGRVKGTITPKATS